jgi:hypothetical protein
MFSPKTGRRVLTEEEDVLAAIASRTSRTGAPAASTSTRIAWRWGASRAVSDTVVCADLRLRYHRTRQVT